MSFGLPSPRLSATININPRKKVRVMSEKQGKTLLEIWWAKLFGKMDTCIIAVENQQQINSQ